MATRNTRSPRPESKDDGSGLREQTSQITTVAAALTRLAEQVHERTAAQSRRRPDRFEDHETAASRERRRHRRYRFPAPPRN